MGDDDENPYTEFEPELDERGGVAVQKMFDNAIEKSQRGKSRGAAGSKGGGGGGGGQPSKRESQISRALSRLLRHQAHSAGIRLDNEAYAPLAKVMAWQPIRSLNVTFAEVVAVVANNAKQRFSLKPSSDAVAATSTNPADWLIRANQGHSIAMAGDSALLRPLELGAPDFPSTAVHGTYFAFWPDIVASGGLRPMRRLHVHFATGLLPGDAAGRVLKPGDSSTETSAGISNNTSTSTSTGTGTGTGTVVSGMRSDAELLIYVDIEATLRDRAMQWGVSSNGVLLTAGDDNGLMPLRYFKEVVGRTENVGTLWRDGQWVADLPAGVRARVPPGKNRGGGGGGGGGGRGRGQGRGQGRGPGGRPGGDRMGRDGQASRADVDEDAGLDAGGGQGRGVDAGVSKEGAE